MDSPTDLDAEQTLALAGMLVERRRMVELDDLLIAAHWAALHSTDPREDPGYIRGQVFGDKLIRVGGEGTPRVRELCFLELGIARQVSARAARSTVADVLDLQHRLPRTWARVEALQADAFVARRVAAKSRELSLEAIATVDAAVASVIGTLPAGRVLAIAEAAIIEADQQAHAEKVEAERRRRFVGLSRTDEHGLRTVIARIEAGAAVWIDAMVERVADILGTRADLRPEAPGDDLTRDELRSVAFGWLARPAELLQLLLETAQQSEPSEEAEGAGVEESRSTAISERALALFCKADLTRLAPTAHLYLHLHQATLNGAPGVARVEGVGPLLLEQLTALLAHTRVQVHPLLDLAEQHAVDAYEHPEAIRQRVRLRSPAEAAPYANRVPGLHGKVDLDHPTPYEATGPPCQTGDHNAAPLTRTTHRTKTHLGYRVAQIGTTAWLWRTPHGLWRVVDHRGTHPISGADADDLTSNDPLDRTLARLWWRHREHSAA